MTIKTLSNLQIAQLAVSTLERPQTAAAYGNIFYKYDGDKNFQTKDHNGNGVKLPPGDTFSIWKARNQIYIASLSKRKALKAKAAPGGGWKFKDTIKRDSYDKLMETSTRITPSKNMQEFLSLP